MDKYGASRVRAELGMIKAHVSKVVLAVLDRTIQVCGALGYSSDLPVEEWYRGTRFGPIGDGPDELHKSVLARTILKGYTPVEGWPTEHIPSRRPGGGGEVAGAAGRGRGGMTAARTELRAVFFDFADTLFSSRDLRDAHLAQLRVVADAVGVHPTDDELRAAYRQGMGVGYRAVATRPAYLHRELFARSYAATAEALGGALDAAACDALVDRQYAATIEAARLRPDCLDTLRALRARGCAHADRLQHRRRAARRAGGATRARGRGRRVDQLRGGSARASPMPASTRSRSRPRDATPVEVLFVGDTRRTRRRGTAYAGDAHRAARRRRPSRRVRTVAPTS